MMIPYGAASAQNRIWPRCRARCYIRAVRDDPDHDRGGEGIGDRNAWRVRSAELLRYGGGSLVMLAVKLAVMQLALLALGEVAAYALVQVFVFLGSYAWHSRMTFGTRFSWASLGRYLRTMVVFQTLDWLVFTVIFTRYGIDSTLVILISTAVVFVLRFLFVRRSLRKD